MRRLVILVDNEAVRPSLGSQHGLSVWLETDSSKTVFDTGQDELFVSNAREMGITAELATHLILSHGHYDHAGGVPALLELGARPRAIVGPEAWSARESSHDIGIPWPRQMLADRGVEVSVNLDVHVIEPGVLVVNSGGAADAPERHPHLRRLVDGQWAPDSFPDEQVLVLKTVEGSIIVSGCAHCGVESLFRAAGKVAGDAPIYAIIGGLHLGSSTQRDILTAAELMRDVPHVWVNHCTGGEACAILRDALGSRVEWAGAGFEISVPDM